MNEFNWETADYPCFGIGKSGVVVCFSSYEHGHVVEDTTSHHKGEYVDCWDINCFKPYTPPKPKTKITIIKFLSSKGKILEMDVSKMASYPPTNRVLDTYTIEVEE